mmetsp:Transcript_2494/g.5173  ORF Transcript_2494/g.5173 Transcript_2494/m.5173 type:complete len:113 (-) Transcript_2494:874-1212(-)
MTGVVTASLFQLALASTWAHSLVTSTLEKLQKAASPRATSLTCAVVHSCSCRDLYATGHALGYAYAHVRPPSLQMSSMLKQAQSMHAQQGPAAMPLLPPKSSPPPPLRLLPH